MISDTYQKLSDFADLVDFTVRFCLILASFASFLVKLSEFVGMGAQNLPLLANNLLLILAMG